MLARSAVPDICGCYVRQVVFHDCSGVFVVNGTLPRDLLHDGLHPSLKGEFFTCTWFPGCLEKSSSHDTPASVARPYLSLL